MIAASNWRSKCAQYLKLKNPHADVTVRDLESVDETIRRSCREVGDKKAPGFPPGPSSRRKRPRGRIHLRSGP
jgi:hypothetical protein